MEAITTIVRPLIRQTTRRKYKLSFSIQNLIEFTHPFATYTVD